MSITIGTGPSLSFPNTSHAGNSTDAAAFAALVAQQTPQDGRAVQRYRTNCTESVPPHMRGEVRRLMQGGISEPANI